MQIDILTIFPEMFSGPFQESILKRAQENNQVSIQLHGLRNWTIDNHRSVDDRPYGGGAGMVMRVDVIDRAVSDLRFKIEDSRLKQLSEKVILLDTKGPFYTQSKAQELAQLDHLILIAGHYEGIDHRVHEHVVDEVISIGPYVLTGGELPTMVIVDSVVRLLPGVINEESLKEESYNNSKFKIQNSKLQEEPNLQSSIFNLEYKQYTRPADYKGWKVPEVLLNGNHREIEEWRKKGFRES